MAEALIHTSCQSNPNVNADIAPDDEVRPLLCSDASGSNLTTADDPAEGQHMRGGRGLICNTSSGPQPCPACNTDSSEGASYDCLCHGMREVVEYLCKP